MILDRRASPVLISWTRDLFWSGDTLLATTALHLVENCRRALRMFGSAIAVIRELPSMIKALGRSGMISDESAVLSTR
jgi:hypothetical protein